MRPGRSLKNITMAKQYTISSTFEVLDSPEALKDQEKELFKAAEKAALNAYAPYSEFKVGAALLLENGSILTGNNQENAAYPSGMCAERVALFYAASQHPEQKIRAIAITSCAKNNPSRLLTPCGACRQAISEYEIKTGSPIRLIMSGEKGSIYISFSVAALLPLMFTKHSF